MEDKKMNSLQEPEMVGEGVGFERIRRITGYLVGTLDRFNNAKRAEEFGSVREDWLGNCYMWRLPTRSLFISCFVSLGRS